MKHFVRTAKTLLALLASALLTAIVCAKEHEKQGHPPGLAKKEAKAEAKGANPAVKTESKPAAKITFTAQEREIIHTYVTSEKSKKGKALPPGLQKKLDRGGELPPGWQKKVVVGQTMPPEVFKVASPLPKELTVKLPPLPVGTITVAVEGKIVRLMEKTREILDVLEFP
jgi:hypothetical protein